MLGFSELLITFLHCLFIHTFIMLPTRALTIYLNQVFIFCRVHVRRTDKVGTEAAFHPIEEYMLHVEDQFQSLARRMHIDKKRVYLATDDPSLLQEAKSKYVCKYEDIRVLCRDTEFVFLATKRSIKIMRCFFTPGINF